MIKLEKVDKYFNRFKRNQIHVINNTSLELGDNGLVALLGPSGSGKTTLLNVIGGLDKVRRGRIYINGRKITHRLQASIDKTRNLNIGYIFQDYKLVEDLSVYDNVSLALKMVGIKDKKEIDKRVCYVLDKVGMLRYKKRPCSMLSGGERQRVGIARAIVKNPSIIIADEPTGNLDSKNSVEVMNIIKAISKEKLVVLVTHEVNLAKFYADRIIELEDGKITNDYINDNQNDLEYEMNNTLYLKDYKYCLENNGIRTYSNEDSKLKINIVVTKNNIYIETNDNRKIEVVDETSSIDMIDDHYKSITKEQMEKYNFDYDKIINNKKLRYSSIFNPITFITNGFLKVLEYPILKKILLIGFFLSGIFIMYSTSSIYTSLVVKDSNFVDTNKEYLVIQTKKNKVEDYLTYEENLKAEYLLPGDSKVKMNLKYDNFYQGSKYTVPINGSLSSLEMIDKNDLVYGRWPENENEIIVDKLTLKKSLKEDLTKMIGLTKNEDFIEKNIIINNMPNMKIVGLVDKNSPSIYVDRSKMINLVYHLDSDNEYDADFESISLNYANDIEDYHLFSDKVYIKEGRWPENDYETIVPYSYKDSMKLNKEINKSINEKKLTVVGYYNSKYNYNYYFVNTNMIKINTILKSSSIVVYSKNKEESIDIGRNNYNLNIKDSYKSSRDKYVNSRRESVKVSLISSGIILAISLIEILLMMRSSFLSRIKEVGTYRAIGVKKKDIYIMFSGEIIAITTFAAIPGILICAYIIKKLSEIPELSDYFMINGMVVITSILLVFTFNLIVGLIPVFNTIRKRPAEILSRTDI